MAKRFQKQGRRFLGIGGQAAIKGFFGGNALLSIAILLLICAFLINEAYRFFPQHHEGLKLYRKAGLEYVDFIKREVEGHTELDGLVAQAYYAELDEIAGRERSLVDAFYAIVAVAEDVGEDEIDELADAIDNLEDAEDGDDAAALVAARQTEADARAAWNEKLAEITRNLKREEVDSYDRLTNDDWTALLNSLPEWDAVEEEPPPLVSKAEADKKAKMHDFEVAKDEFAAAIAPLRQFKERLRTAAMEVKAEAVADQSAVARKAALLEGALKAEDSEERKRREDQAAKIVIRDEFPFEERTRQFYESKPEHAKLAEEYLVTLRPALAKLPVALGSPRADASLKEVRGKIPQFLTEFERSREGVQKWRHDEHFGWGKSLTMFFFGKDWVTNSSWHDFYGLLPLLTGSLVISGIALLVAVPFSIGAAIYVNQLARPLEQNIIKPAIEFVQAIPSVVLGFFGIIVLGSLLREVSNWEALSWVPGFPMQERLNMLNAGLLLGLMAVPTIFTLCEDALNNVPQAFTESSLALGASKMQTILRVLLPTAISGILAAILLGFGRVIGETMVVLLVAGNQIAIPDFSEGIGVVTQPAHTMTGIIAQETGEVDQGSLHWRALFLVGLILFMISLFINWSAQRIISKFRLA